MKNKPFFTKFAVFLQLFASAICVIAFVLLIMGTVGFSTQVSNATQTVQHLTTVETQTDEGEKEVTLPISFKSLSARTPVIITTNFTPKSEDFLYIKSVYAPLTVYANDKVIYEYGQKGSYPAFLKDPPTGVAIVPLPDISQSVTLRMEYLSPVSRNILTVHPVMLGSTSAILNNLVTTLGVPFGFSVIQMFIGVLLILVALVVIFFERKGLAFLWLGLFAFLSGLWAFGECNLSGIFIHNPTLLYLFAFCGMFLMPIPLFYFGMAVVDFHDKRPLKHTANIMTGVAVISLLLQLLGLVALYKIMYLFQVLLMLSLIMLTVSILYEGVHYKNKAAMRFFLPTASIALFCVLEWINYQIRFTNVIALLFQIGIMVFVLVTGVIGGLMIRNALQVERQKQQLAFEVITMETQLTEQKKHYDLILKNAEDVKIQYHDLRHQLMVIRRYSDVGDKEKLTDYLNTLIVKIPVKQMDYCENVAVNAITSHYIELAEKRSIRFSTKMIVPENIQGIRDTSLCVIFGNLFENAVEGSLTVSQEERFIQVNADRKSVV